MVVLSHLSCAQKYPCQIVTCTDIRLWFAPSDWTKPGGCVTSKVSVSAEKQQFPFKWHTHTGTGKLLCFCFVMLHRVVKGLLLICRQRYRILRFKMPLPHPKLIVIVLVSERGFSFQTIFLSRYSIYWQMSKSVSFPPTNSNINQFAILLLLYWSSCRNMFDPWD